MNDKVSLDDEYIELVDMIDEDIIELTDIIYEKDDEFADSNKTIELVDNIEKKPSLDVLDIRDEQIKEVLRQLIEEKFGQEIKPILFAAIKKVVNKEIEDIKESLKDDLDYMEQV